MTLVEFLQTLDGRRVAYRLDRVRDAVMVQIASPGKRWEIEFMDGGEVEVEVFAIGGTIADERSLSDLLQDLE